MLTTLKALYGTDAQRKAAGVNVWSTAPDAGLRLIATVNFTAAMVRDAKADATDGEGEMFVLWMEHMRGSQANIEEKPGLMAKLREKFAPEAPELTAVPANPAAALVAQFRNIEQRALRVGLNIAAETAHDWGNQLIASGVVGVALYQGYADQLEAFVAGREAARREIAA
ncbi:MAG TPA: hypothetical protein VF503_00175 [Sphingobium sp.]|uniref:hypothetical protein n=1 Tax=Sphingobium sp. TaxID=1912891 RepID=UPI002ED147D7